MTDFKEYAVITYPDQSPRMVEARETKLYFICKDGTRFKKATNASYLASLRSGDRWYVTISLLYEKDAPEVLEIIIKLRRGGIHSES